MGYMRPWAISDSFNNEDFVDEIDGLGEALADYYYSKNPLQRLWSWFIGEGVIIHKILNAAQEFYYRNRNADRAAAWAFFQKFEKLAYKNSHGIFTALRHELTELLTQQLELFAQQAQTNYAELVRTGFKKSSRSSPKSTAAAPTQSNHWWSKKSAPATPPSPTSTKTTSAAQHSWWPNKGPSLTDSVQLFTLACKKERSSSSSSSSGSSSNKSGIASSFIRIQT